MNGRRSAAAAMISATTSRRTCRSGPLVGLSTTRRRPDHWSSAPFRSACRARARIGPLAAGAQKADLCARRDTTRFVCRIPRDTHCGRRFNAARADLPTRRRANVAPTYLRRAHYGRERRRATVARMAPAQRMLINHCAEPLAAPRRAAPSRTTRGAGRTDMIGGAHLARPSVVDAGESGARRLALAGSPRAAIYHAQQTHKRPPLADSDRRRVARTQLETRRERTYGRSSDGGA